jgi:hypothetical protein
MLRLSLFAALALACVAAAHAQNAMRPEPPPPDARVYDMARFCARTSNQTRFFPRRAVEHSVTGEAAVDCMLNDDGSLRTCQIVREAPSGYEFGEAALKIACRVPAGAWEAASANNMPYADDAGQRRVRRTVRFQFGGASSAPPHGSITN